MVTFNVGGIPAFSKQYNTKLISDYEDKINMMGINDNYYGDRDNENN